MCIELINQLKEFIIEADPKVIMEMQERLRPRKLLDYDKDYCEENERKMREVNNDEL